MAAGTADEPRFVAVLLGPTRKTASISPDVNDRGFRLTSFDELVEVYTEAMGGLVDGGVDIILVETIFGTLNAKAALCGASKYVEDKRFIVDSSGLKIGGQGEWHRKKPGQKSAHKWMK